MKIDRSLQPPKSNEEREAKLEIELNPKEKSDSIRLMSQFAPSRLDVHPSRHMGEAQAEFMAPACADRDSNKKSGAV